MKIFEDTSLKMSEFLLQIKAIKLNVAKPFKWASGLNSPIYCDNRLTLSYPKIRTFIRQEFVKIINEEYGPVDVIAGVATGAIAHGALVAQDLGLPFVYVRSAQKTHGMGNKVEGRVNSGQSVVVIEDLISTGKSSLAAVSALRELGCNVKGMIAIFSYMLPIAKKNFKDANCPLFTLSDYNTLIQQALNEEYITESDLNKLLEWSDNPEKWSEKFNK